MTDACYAGASHNRPTRLTDDSAADTVTSAAIAIRESQHSSRALSERQFRLAVVMPGGGLVERVLTIVNLDSVAEVRRTLDEALEAVAAG
jgi:hypothetical protein